MSADRLMLPLPHQLAYPNTHLIPVEPTDPEYTDPEHPVGQSFDWDFLHTAFAETRGLSPYETTEDIFVFRSLRKANLSLGDVKKLAEVDDVAYKATLAGYSNKDNLPEDLLKELEAFEHMAPRASDKAQTESFLRYKGGHVDAQGWSLSWCGWTSAVWARLAVQSRAHGDAAGMIKSYEATNTSWYRLAHVQELGCAALLPINFARPKAP